MHICGNAQLWKNTLNTNFSKFTITTQLASMFAIPKVVIIFPKSFNIQLFSCLSKPVFCFTSEKSEYAYKVQSQKQKESLIFISIIIIIILIHKHPHKILIQDQCTTDSWSWICISSRMITHPGIKVLSSQSS